MHHGTLFWWQFGQGLRQFEAKRLFVRVIGWGKQLERFFGQSLRGTMTDGPATNEIDGQIVRQAEEESSFVPDAVQNPGTFSQAAEELLDDIVRVDLVAGDIQDKGEEGLAVTI